MIFRDIKQHNKIYILDKNNMTIKEGIVTAVGIPQPNIEGKIVIDVTISVDDKIATYSIPE
jgi:co-chaperonin GroES (HSP10)